MPYKSEKIKLPKEYDKRIRFTDEKKVKADLLYSQGESIRKIAKILEVNKRTIQFYFFPERLERNIELRKARGGSKIYYNREKNTKAIKDLRHRKQELYLKGRTKMLIDKEIIELLEKLNKTEESKHDSIFKKYMDELLQKTK